MRLPSSKLLIPTVVVALLLVAPTVFAQLRTAVQVAAQSTPDISPASRTTCAAADWQLDPKLGAVQAIPLFRSSTVNQTIVEGCVFVHMEHGWVALWFTDLNPRPDMAAADLETEFVLVPARED